MRLETRVSVLVPTYNRPFFVRKLLRYYARFESAPALVIADSSEPGAFRQTADSIRLFPNLTVVHAGTPGLRAISAARASLSRLNSDYAILTGDDDFLAPQSLVRFVTFLDRRPDYHAAISGIVRPKLIPHPGGLSIERILPGTSGLSTVADASAARRLVRVFRPTQVNTFALHRTAAFKEILTMVAAQEFESHPSTYALAEVLQIGLTVLHGRQRFFPGTFLFMCLYLPNRTQTPWRGEFSMLRQATDPHWSPAVAKICELWGRIIREKDGGQADTAETIAAEAMFTWLYGHFESRSSKSSGTGLDWSEVFLRLSKLAPSLTVANIRQKLGAAKGPEYRAVLEIVRQVLEFPEEGVAL